MATGVALVLTACGGGGSSSNGADSGEVTFWDTSGPNESPAFTKIANDCATKGGYKVKVETQAFDTALANYKTAAQGGQGPDVFRAEVAWVPQLAKLSYIADLSDTDLAKDTSDFLEAPLGSTKFEGKTYAVPQVTDSLALLYNKKKLADAGVSRRRRGTSSRPPRPSWAARSRSSSTTTRTTRCRSSTARAVTWSTPRRRRSWSTPQPT